MKIKVLLTVIALSLPLSATPNYVNYFGWCTTGNIKTVTQGLPSTTPVMGSFPACSVQVNLHGGGLAAIYSDKSGTVLPNPFNAATSGIFNFYIDTTVATEFDITLSGGNPAFPTSLTYYDVFIQGSGSGASGVSSFSGDGVLITNVGSTGAVTATVGTAPSHKFWNGAWTQPACGDLSNGGTACTATAPANTPAVTHDYVTAYNSTTGAFTQQRPVCADLSDSGPGCTATGVISGLTTNGLVTAASATTIQTPAGYSWLATTGNTIPAPTGTGVALTMTGDNNSSDILHVNVHAGTNAFKVDNAGDGVFAGTLAAGSTLTAPTGTFSGTINVGGASAVGSFALKTTSGTNTIQTTSAATGFTWTYPAATGTLVPRVYTQRLTGQTSAITDTTMLTVGATSTLYHFLGVITCESTSAAATVTLTLKWTDVGSFAETKSTSAIDCTTQNASANDQLTWTIEAKTGTTVKWATTIANTPTYTVDVRLLQP